MAKWVEHLKNGKIEYKVPPIMLLHKTATAAVVIHGYEDINTTTLSGATGSGTLKQSERMKVELLAMDNPGDFTIALKDGDSVRFVPIDSGTTWLWDVTPNASGLKQRMMVRASIVYPGTDDKTEQQLPDYTAIVEVDVPSLWTTVKKTTSKTRSNGSATSFPAARASPFLRVSRCGCGDVATKRRKPMLPRLAREPIAPRNKDCGYRSDGGSFFFEFQGSGSTIAARRNSRRRRFQKGAGEPRGQKHG